MLRMVPLPITMRWGGPPYRFHHQGIDDHLSILFPIAKAPPVKLGEVGTHLLRRRDGNLDGRVAAGCPKPRATKEFDALAVQALLDERIASATLKLPHRRGESLGPRLQPAPFA